MIELIHKRKWDSKVFDTGRTHLIQGIEKPIYGTKLQNGLHDIEPDGSFVDVNTLFQPYAVGVSTDKVIRNRCGEVRASDTASESKDLAKIKTKNLCGVSLKLKGYRTYGPHSDDLKSTYYTTNDGITLKYFPNYKGVNIVIVIDNPQTASNVYRFSIQEYGCSYTYEKTEDGIKCISSTGQDDILIKALYVKDANDDYGVVDIDLDGVENGRQIIKKTIAPVWLGNAVGPVELDPSVTIEDGVDGGIIADTIFNNSDNNNWGAATFLQIRDNKLSSSGLRVDLSSYSEITILNSKYIFTVSLAALGDFTNYVYPILRQWNEGTKSGSAASTGEATGLSARHNEEAWTSGNCTGSGTDHDSTAIATFSSPRSTGALEVPISASATQNKIDNPSTNYGDVFRTEAGGTTYWRPYSGEGTTPPQFYFEYIGGDNYIPFFFDAGHY